MKSKKTKYRSKISKKRMKHISKSSKSKKDIMCLNVEVKRIVL